MRALAFACLLLLLAGCTKDGHDLDPYMLEPFDLPDACYHIDLDDEEYQELKAVGIRENPGSLNNTWFTIDGIAPTDNRYAMFECQLDGEHQVASIALQFEDSHVATDWVLAAQDGADNFAAGAECVPQAMVFVDGDVVGAFATISEEWHPAVYEKARAAFDALIEDGAKDYCT